MNGPLIRDPQGHFSPPRFVGRREGPRVRIRKGLHLTFSFEPERGVTCTWEPDVPTELGTRDMRRYREARDAFFADITSHLEGNTLVIET